MVYYTLYPNWKKLPTELMLRTPDDSEDNPTFGKMGDEPRLFSSETEARQDFYSILYDNPDYRQGQYFDTETKKKEKVKKVVIEREVRINKIYTDIEVNKHYNEDCMLTMGRMPNHFVDISITSPPYNKGEGQNIRGDMYADYEDNLSEQEYRDWLFGVIDELLRVTRKHIFFNIQMLGQNKLIVLEIFGHYRNNIKDRMIWNKNIAPPHIVPGVMNSKFEDIIIFSNQKPHQKKFEDANFAGNFNNVLEGRNAGGNKYSKLNKATFPGYVPRTILNMFGDKNDLIYDPFGGTGTTAESCIIENRRWITSELSSDLADVIEKRTTEEESKLRLNF